MLHNKAPAENEESTTSVKTVLLAFMAVAGVTLIAGVAMPACLPGLTNSLLGSQPKVFWLLSRGSALVAFALLWLSMAFGIAISNKMAQLWPGGPAAFELHEYASLLGLGFALFHALILVGDQYIHYNLAQLAIPFASQAYRPIWVGLGQLGFYLWVLVAFTFYLRKRIGNRAWRMIHYSSFAMFFLALIHGLASGTDSSAAWARGMYWFSGASLLFLLIYRILAALSPVGRQAAVAPITSQASARRAALSTVRAAQVLPEGRRLPPGD